ncbi:NAD(P)H-hydrate dehydratase [Sphingomonas sp. So64.6b]|uniref:NAD(P)H-hydrate dehydratase n=1 Tax=Sphingomonas sp. So64.6b TaxID=2997354 RepID=UPI0031F70B32
MGQPVLTAAEMRAAEDAAIANGATVDSLMARAGLEVALAVRRLASGREVLILCGPGNNGGDGYVVAAALKGWGLPVRVAASTPPTTDAARKAHDAWGGPVENLHQARPSPILVDALFGTGMSRPLKASICDQLRRLNDRAHLSIAIDLPSGVGTDDGALLGDIPVADVTLALAAAKPAHLLYPAAGRCGAVRVLDIGMLVSSNARVINQPLLRSPGADSHKYSRGMVTIIGGDMPGAAELAAVAALRAGAGYLLLLAEGDATQPHAIVRKPFTTDALADKRIGALVIGPGLGRGAEARARLSQALSSSAPLLVDGDALHLLDDASLSAIHSRAAPVIMTPHAGEFDSLFGKGGGSKIDRARVAAVRAGATIVLKGADTVIASPDGQARIAWAANPWLSTAGTGDVLAGAIGALLASGLSPIDAASAGVWCHGEAASSLKGAFIADDVAYALTAVRSRS